MIAGFLRRFPAILMALLLMILSTACRTPIEDSVLSSDTTSATQSTALHNPDARPVQSGDLKYTFEGSYLTVRTATITSEIPYAVSFNSYYEVESYFYSHELMYFYGARFTIACASFTDDYLKDHDVVILVIDSPTTYASYVSKGIENVDGKTVFSLEMHQPNEAPEQDGIYYHLIFTAPKGSFADIDVENIEVQMTTVIDPVVMDVYDAEQFRYVYPEFWPFSYDTAPISDTPSIVVNTMETYEELLSFYENYKTEFDLEREFLSSIGQTYSEDLFKDYIVMAAILPYDTRKDPAEIYDVFVYNLNVWLSVSNHAGDVPKEFTGWRLVTVAVAKKNLDGVNLKEFFIES